MARIDSLGNFLTDVADAIREKKGTSDLISAEDFDTEIANLPSGGGLDWSAIGYSGTPQSIIDDYNYSKDIYDNWDSSQTNLSSKFQGDKYLAIMPLVDTSNATSVYAMFAGCSILKSVPLLDISNATNTNSMFDSCSSLETVPAFDFSKSTNMRYIFIGCTNLKNISEFNVGAYTNVTGMFQNCPNLTDESLDNILKMCSKLDVYTKTLSNMGFMSNYYPATRIQALPHYQDFINAGWTIGY